LNSIATRGEADLLAELAYPLPVDVICELLGIPESDRHRFPAWAQALVARLDLMAMRTPAVDERGDAAVMELTAYLEALLKNPTDLLSGGLCRIRSVVSALRSTFANRLLIHGTKWDGRDDTNWMVRG
jgi:cytochrome P450